jgi:putative ABC transport system permease protein
MRFFGLVAHNTWTKKVRSLLTAIAIAIAVMVVLTLGLITQNLKTTAASILKVGKADFTVAQRGASDVLLSSLTGREVQQIEQTAGVQSAVGVLLDTERLNADNPLFVEIGIDPSELQPFGVHVLQGRAPSPNAGNEMMLGWRIAQDLGLQPGGTLNIAGGEKVITGTFSTGNVFGDSAGIFPLIPFQAHERQPDSYSLAFVRVQQGTSIPGVEKDITSQNEGLTTIRSLAQFGRADRNFELVSTADRGATIVAIIVGAFIVTNTMLLSLVERTREFGILRSIGWSGRRVISLIMSEAALISVAGAALGVALAVALLTALTHLHTLEALANPNYNAGLFARALVLAAVVAFLGALYPSLRASLIRPVEALRRE